MPKLQRIATGHILDSDHALGKVDERRDNLKIAEMCKTRAEAKSAIKKAGIPSGSAVFLFFSFIRALNSAVKSGRKRLQCVFAEVSASGKTNGDETVKQ